MRTKIAALALAALFVGGCNLVKDTGDTAQQGGEGAVSTAEKMKGGTVGETDMDTGESQDDAQEGGD